MALTVASRRALAFGLKSQPAADEVAAVLDAGSGTLSVNARRRFRFGMNNPAVAKAACDSIDAGTAISGAGQASLGILLNSRVRAQEIATILAS